MKPEAFQITLEDPLSEPEVRCNACGEVVCTVEIGDDLANIVDTAEEHARGCAFVKVLG